MAQQNETAEPSGANGNAVMNSHISVRASTHWEVRPKNCHKMVVVQKTYHKIPHASDKTFEIIRKGIEKNKAMK